MFVKGGVVSGRSSQLMRCLRESLMLCSVTNPSPVWLYRGVKEAYRNPCFYFDRWGGERQAK